MNDGAELLMALEQVEREKGIDREVIFDAIETSLVSACKKNFGTSQNIKILVNRYSGEVQVFAEKTVVEFVSDPLLEISLEDAQDIEYFYEIGDIVPVEITPRNFGRISAQTAKQVVVQKFREAERDILFNQFISKEREVLTGIVQRKEKRNFIISLGKIEAIMMPSEQMPGEDLKFQDRVKVFVVEVKQTTKGPHVYVSRTHPELVRRLFEQEVPEIFEGVVEIKALSREAGSRTKMAVFSKDPNVDAVGSCVGANGCRVNVIVSELKDEKIDIINWSPNPKVFLAAALSPAKVSSVIINDLSVQSAKVIVPDNQLSLAIGREGQNARLAARLTGWRIDIKSESQAHAADFLTP